MNAITAYARLQALRVPVVTTSDAAAALGQSAFAASKTLVRLAVAGLVTPVRRGTWWLGRDLDPLRLPGFLTAPLPSYLSLHTALHVRGLIEQVPVVVYAVSLARTQRIVAGGTSFSIHHTAPEIFGGFDELPSGVLLATAEKALFDFAYLSGGRSRLFTSLPEVELPRGFRKRSIERWIDRIPSQRGKTLTRKKIEALLARATR